MNLCNFSKVILARSTKDLSTIKWWNDKENSPESLSPNYTSYLTMPARHQNYLLFMKNYPKMHIDLKYMQKRIQRLQNYLNLDKYWKNNGSNGERNAFVQYFSLQNWEKLGHGEKNQHSLIDCKPCNTIHIKISELHNSTSQTTSEMYKNIEQATENLMTVVSPTSSTKEKGLKVVKSVVNIIQPIIEDKLNTKFDSKLAECLTLSPAAKPQEQQKELEKSVTTIRNKFAQKMADNGNDLFHLLSSGKSFNSYSRDRLSTFFESQEMAESRVHHQLSQGNIQKQHHGKFENYIFDKITFLQDMKNMEPGAKVNWSAMAKKYNVKINGEVPKNAGQVLLEFAKCNEIDTTRFNTEKRISKRDYLRRIRKSKKKISLKNKNISLPTPRTIALIKKDMKQKLQSGELYIGEKVAYKNITKTSLSANGELIETSTELYARKFSLEHIRQTSLEEQFQQGILRYRSDDDYRNLSEEYLKQRLEALNEQFPENKDNAIEKLKHLERTRKLKLWHDHSDILNHSYVCFTINYMYDDANFLTDEEYKQKFPGRKFINVQSLVERPRLYIFGQSGKIFV